ncbi:cytochrome P450 [Kitasatospora sp. NPDC008115]|uniref:cytochrome P450 family protein n=1 Tax=Kitasatospora sp. NPDC008115 TaxID=3364022 RepID=UPI0036E2AB97
MKQAPTLQELAPDGHDLAADPFPLYEQLRAKGPVHRIHVPESGACWLVVTRDAARQALTDPRLRNDIAHSSSWRTDGGHAIGRNMLQSDPPQHTHLRRLVAGHFAPARITALHGQIEAIADDLLATLPERGTVDLVHRYALPLPVAVICALLGVPEADRAPFHTWSTELVLPSSPEAAAAASAELASYISDLTASADPIGGRAQGSDSTLLADLAAAERAARGPGPGAQAAGLTREELLGMVFLLLVAGHETTVNLISATVHSLLAHPAQLALLRADPALLPRAVEESLRYNTPVRASAFRFAAEPLDLAGTPVAAGDAVLVSLAAASRDPLPFPAPDRFDIRRQGPGHLGFGHGPHHCLGAPLARAETTVALRRLLERHPAIDFATDPSRLTWRTSTLLRGLAELPVRLG